MNNNDIYQIREDHYNDIISMIHKKDKNLIITEDDEDAIWNMYEKDFKFDKIAEHIIFNKIKN